MKNLYKLPIALIVIFGFSCEHDAFQDMFEQPKPQQVSFVKDTDLGIQVLFSQEQDPVTKKITMNSKITIKAVNQSLTNVTLVVAIRKLQGQNFKTIVRKQINNLQLEKDGEITYELANRLETVFGEGDVLVNVVKSGVAGADYQYAGIYFGNAISYKNGKVRSGSLTDIVIDYRGSYDLELSAPLDQIRFLQGVNITSGSFIGSTYSNANSDLGGFTGTVTTVSGAPDSLRISVAMTNTTDVETIAFKIKRVIP